MFTLRKLFLICGIFILLGCKKTTAKPSETTTPEYFEAATQDYSEIDATTQAYSKTQESTDTDFKAYSKDPKEANKMLVDYLEKQDKTASDISLISINSGNFTDYTPLLDFKNLKTLYIDNKLLTDINGIIVLSQLEKLTSLTLWAEKVTDISPLSVMKNLRSLSVDVENTCTDASELLPLVNLETLVFKPASSEAIRNISKLTWLKGLHILIENETIDISPVKNLRNLEYLEIFEAIHEKTEFDISWISQLVKLREIELSGFKITDVSPFLKLPKIEVINVMFSEISDENIALLKKTGATVYTHADADH
jgi:Leucine-rich repeat (LRR) protein